MALEAPGSCIKHLHLPSRSLYCLLDMCQVIYFILVLPTYCILLLLLSYLSGSLMLPQCIQQFHTALDLCPRPQHCPQPGRLPRCCFRTAFSSDHVRSTEGLWESPLRSIFKQLRSCDGRPKTSTKKMPGRMGIWKESRSSFQIFSLVFGKHLDLLL